MRNRHGRRNAIYEALKELHPPHTPIDIAIADNRCPKCGGRGWQKNDYQRQQCGDCGKWWEYTPTVFEDVWETVSKVLDEAEESQERSITGGNERAAMSVFPIHGGPHPMWL